MSTKPAKDIDNIHEVLLEIEKISDTNWVREYTNRIRMLLLDVELKLQDIREDSSMCCQITMDIDDVHESVDLILERITTEQE